MASETRVRQEGEPGDKGLRSGTLGFVSNVVIGVASTAPGYSLAAVLAFMVAAVGVQAPAILFAAFIPMLLVAAAYYYLLAIFIYWGWDATVTVNEESKDATEGPGKAAIVSTLILSASTCRWRWPRSPSPASTGWPATSRATRSGCWAPTCSAPRGTTC